MKINKITIDDNYQHNFKNNNIIYSNRNSVGKTTFIRLILFALGFSIPSTKKFNFNKKKITINIVVNSNEFTITRENDLIHLEKNKKHIKDYNKKTANEMLSFIFDIDNNLIINNILGTFYFDQEKGWTLLNKGEVIDSNNKFDISDFLGGINKLDLNEYNNEKNDISLKLKFYRNIGNIIKLNNEENLNNLNFTDSDKLENKLYKLQITTQQTKDKINDLKKIQQSNEDFINLIDNYHLVVNSKNGEKIEVNRNSIENFNLNEDIIETQIIHLHNDLNDLNSKKQTIQDNIKNISLVNGLNKLSRIQREINNSNISTKYIDDICDELVSRRSKVNDMIKDTVRKSSITNELYMTIIKFAKELGIESYIDKKKDFVFTKRLSYYSGAILHLIVFAYRMSLLKLVDKHLSIKLPIIIDSPATGELDTKNLTKMFNLLKKHFSDHQLMVASIKKDKTIHWDSELLIKENLMKALK